MLGVWWGFLGALCFFCPEAWADLKTAKEAYAVGDYDRAIEELRSLLYPVSQLAAKYDEIEAHTLLGASYFYKDDHERARKEFREVLRLEPEAVLDPFKFPPGMREVFDGVRKEIDLGKEILRRDTLEKRFSKGLTLGEELLLRQIAMTPKFFEITVEKRSYALSYFPIAGQFQNGDWERGVALLAGEAIALGTHVGTFLYLRKVTRLNALGQRECLVEDPNPDGGLDAIEYCQLARQANIGSFIAALGILGLGIYDARKRFVPEIRRLKEVPPEVGRKLQRKTSALPLRLEPVIGLGGEAGLSLGIDF